MDGRLDLRDALAWIASDDAVGFSADPPEVRGWIVPDPDAPDQPPEIGLDIEGHGTRVLLAGPARDGLGRFALAWPLPAALCDGTARAARAFHMATGRELAGPLHLLAACAEAAPETALDPLRDWCAGLAGVVQAGPTTALAAGLHVTAGTPATSLRYELVAQPPAAAGEAPRHGVRVMANAASARVILYFRVPDVTPEAGTTLQATAWLPEATEANMQARIEYTLNARIDGAFRPLRRLHRGRLFRRPQRHDIPLTISAEEQPVLAAGGTWLGLEAQSAKGLAALTPHSLAPHSLAPHSLAPMQTSGRFFEDPRLEGAFAQSFEFVRAHGEAAACAHPLLPAFAAPPPATLPARAAGAAHPFTQVILPVYNGSEEVKACLRSLRNSAGGPMQVVIVDDGSREFTGAMLEAEAALDPRFVLHRRDLNRGYTKSINEAVRMTSADWVVVLNSDTLLPPDWLVRLHAAARARPGTGMAGPLSNAATWQSIPDVKRPDGSWSTNDGIAPECLLDVQALVDLLSERAYPEFPVLNGFCTLIARAVFDRVGLYDEEAFPMGYGEETDLCLRARRAGFRLTVADDAFVHHHKSVSFGSAARSRLTRAGGLEMTNKHLGIIVPALERAMQDCAPLRRLRARFAEHAPDLGWELG